MPLPRHRVRRLALAGIIAAVSSLLGAMGVVQFRADASWQGMHQQFSALERAVAARPHVRQPAWGEPTTESAFACYERATTAVAAFEKGNFQLLVCFLSGTDAAIAADTTVRPRWSTVLEPLRAGAHATDTRVPGDSSLLQQPYGVVHLLPLRWVANVGMFEARALLHEGRDLDAVRTSLDATTLGLDTIRTGALINQMIGAAVLAIGPSMWTEERLSALSPAALEALASGLEHIDRELPATIDLESEALVMARAIRHLPISEALGSTGGSWRYGFSARWMLADSFGGYVEVAQQIDAADALPWPQRQALMELAIGEHVDRGNALLGPLGGTLTSGERSLRQTVAMLRLLRMAVDLHRGLDLPPLRDPLDDGPIRVTKSETGTRLHCHDTDEQPRLARVVRR